MEKSPYFLGMSIFSCTSIIFESILIDLPLSGTQRFLASECFDDIMNLYHYQYKE